MTSLGIERVVDTTPEAIWTAFTDPTRLVTWFWPHLDNTATIDLQVGGAYRFDGPKAALSVSGHYLEVARPLRLAFSWQWAGEERTSQVAVELHAEPDGGTLMTLVHIGLADRDERDSHIQGWSDCLDRLVAHLEGG